MRIITVQNADNVTANITSNSPYVVIEEDWSSINFGSIVSGETIAGNTPFVVSLEQGIPDGVELGLVNL